MNTRYGRSVHNASEFYDDIRRDTHSDVRRRCKKATFTALVIDGKLPDYLADVNEQAEKMLFQLVKQMAKDEGVDEAMKSRDQLYWIGCMNNIRNRAEEAVLNEIIYR